MDPVYMYNDRVAKGRVSQSVNEGSGVKSDPTGAARPHANSAGVSRDPVDDIARLREAELKKYRGHLDTTSFEALNKLNVKYTKAVKSQLPEENFDIIGSESHRETPVVWQTSIGEPSRLFGRTSGVRYSR